MTTCPLKGMVCTSEQAFTRSARANINMPYERSRVATVVFQSFSLPGLGFNLVIIVRLFFPLPETETQAWHHCQVMGRVACLNMGAQNDV